MAKVITQWFVNPRSGQKFQASGPDIEYQRQRGMTPITAPEEVEAGDNSTAERLAEIERLMESPEVKALAETHGIVYGELSHAEKMLLARIAASRNTDLVGRPAIATPEDLADENARLRKEAKAAKEESADRMAQENEELAAEKFVAEAQAEAADNTRVAMETPAATKSKK